MEINNLIKMWGGSACRVTQAHTVLFFSLFNDKNIVLPEL